MSIQRKNSSLKYCEFNFKCLNNLLVIGMLNVSILMFINENFHIKKKSYFLLTIRL